MLLVRAIVGHQCEALSPLGDLHKSPLKPVFELHNREPYLSGLGT